MFQNNVIGKLFTITRDVLVDLELSKADTSAIDQAVGHWNDRLGVWVKAREGSVIDLTHSMIGNNVFFKAANVTRYHGFQELLKTVSPKCVQNPCLPPTSNRHSHFPPPSKLFISNLAIPLRQ
jgi:hypothetical protein